jgi:hypothetical protein
VSEKSAAANAVSHLVHNGQVKLAATALNNVGVASVVTGVIVPLVARAASSATPGSRYWAGFVIFCG